MTEIKLFGKTKIDAEIEVAADKSITHRAIMLASLSDGVCEIKNFLSSEDCFSTINAFRAMGVDIKESNGPTENLTISGAGINGLKQPKTELNAGNSGTTTRLLAGILAGQNFSCKIIGDSSLSKRPMRRIIEPLERMGAKIVAMENNYLPMEIKGNPDLRPIVWNSKISSAQVKSCILFAGMYANGETIYQEQILSRNHTERMMKYIGLPIETKNKKTVLRGKVKNIKSFELVVPNDPSAASYFIALTILLKDSKILIKNVCINPTRIGFINTLLKMGAKITMVNQKIMYNEPVADIEVKSSNLRSIKLSSKDIPSMIDEIPLLAVLATQADGVTEIRGAKELRIKESDRIKTICSQLNELGAKIIEQEDGMIIMGGTKLRPSKINSFGDHRIAMSLAIASSIIDGETILQNPDCVNISFPKFWELFKSV